MLKFLLPFILVTSCGMASQKVRTLYNALPPGAFIEKLAFYELYPNTAEGKQAIKEAFALFDPSGQGILMGLTDVQDLVNALSAGQQKIQFSQEAIASIDRMACNLPNRKLQGWGASCNEQLVLLPPDQIDIASALFTHEDQSYSAFIDLIALFVQSKLPLNPTAQQTIEMLNRVIFFDMGFRFPPKSRYEEEIDRFTSLPAILDSRQGVCLGVSVLYLALAQRLNLPLEMVTPPGHIYVRFNEGGSIINIETTARGVHIDSQEYLGLENHSLQTRSIKEVIGLVSFNNAAAHLGKNRMEPARACYEKARLFLPEDPLVNELYAYTLLFTGEEKKGMTLLADMRGHIAEDQFSSSALAEDLLDGYADKDGLQLLLSLPEDETIDALDERANQITQALVRTPNFRSLIFQAGALELKRHRPKDALAYFNRYYTLDPKKPTALWMLVILNAQRLNGQKAWEKFHELEEFYSSFSYKPRMLKEARLTLSALFPE